MSDKTKSLIGNIISAVAEIVTGIVFLVLKAEPPALITAMIVVGAICQALSIQFMAPASITSKKDAIGNIVSGAVATLSGLVTMNLTGQPVWLVVVIVAVDAVCQALGVRFIPPATTATDQ